MIKHITNREMVESGWLTDYQLVNLFSEEHANKFEHVIASIKYAFNTIGSKKICVYSSTCKDAKKLRDMTKGMLKSKVFYIDGSTPEHEREEVFNYFRDTKYRETRCILFNVAVVKVGVDLRLLDTIMFADPKSSCIDIIQIIGRMQRPDFDKNGVNLKEISNLVIPCVDGDYTTVRAVFAALAHNNQLSLSKEKLKRSSPATIDKVVGELTEKVKYSHARLKKSGSSKLIKSKAIVRKILKSIVCEINGSGIKTAMSDKLNILLSLAKEVSTDGLFDRKDFFKRVEDYGYDKLSFGGKTPQNTLSNHLTDKLCKRHQAVEMIKKGTGKYRLLKETV